MYKENKLQRGKCLCIIFALLYFHLKYVTPSLALIMMTFLGVEDFALFVIAIILKIRLDFLYSSIREGFLGYWIIEPRGFLAVTNNRVHYGIDELQ